MNFTAYGNFPQLLAAKKAAVQEDGALDSDSHVVIRFVKKESDNVLIEAGWREVRQGNTFLVRPYAHRITFTSENQGTMEDAPEFLIRAGNAPARY